MTEPRDDHLQQHPTGAGDSASEVEVLIGRFLDGEAAAPDVDRLTSIVGPRDEATMRSFLERHRDHSMLRDQVGAELAGTDGVDLPDSNAGKRAAPWRMARQGVAYLGWAAAIALGVFLYVRGERPAPQLRVIDQERMQPHVVGERELGIPLDPMVTHTELLPDGRFLLTIIERSVKQKFLDQLDSDWIRVEEQLPALDGASRSADL